MTKNSMTNQKNRNVQKKGKDMKHYVDAIGRPMIYTTQVMIDIALSMTDLRIRSGRIKDKTLIKVIREAQKNREEITKTIEQSETHKTAQEKGISELHFIVLVDGKAVCASSMLLDVPSKKKADEIHFVYGKTYSKHNIDDFYNDILTSDGHLGLDTYVFPFFFKVFKHRKQSAKLNNNFKNKKLSKTKKILYFNCTIKDLRNDCEDSLKVWRDELVKQLKQKGVKNCEKMANLISGVLLIMLMTRENRMEFVLKGLKNVFTIDGNNVRYELFN